MIGATEPTTPTTTDRRKSAWSEAFDGRPSCTSRNQWPDVEHALSYLAIADAIPHRTEGEAVLLEVLPERCERVLDLGTGDGRTLALVRTARPGGTAVAVDFSPAMLDTFRTRFAGVPDDEVRLVVHDLEQSLPAEVTGAGPYDAVVSSFAIHHLPHERKASLCQEVRGLLRPGGVFANLEHVESATRALHSAFQAALPLEDRRDDPSNILAPVEHNLTWLRDAGFDDVDCLWRWRELALLVGTRPA